MQVAVVTGAAGGFGSGIVKSFLDVGYFVVATDINVQAMASLEKHLGHPEKMRSMVMDVTNIGSVEKVAEEITISISKKITVLVNNAGIIGRNFCLKEDCTSETKKIFDVNLNGAFNCTSVFARCMARQKYGRIINIASIAGIQGAAGGAAYSASKAGLIKASESWARELGPLNISVTAVAPGICKTNMFGQLVDEKNTESSHEDKVVKSMVPIGRLGNVEDVAEVVTFLATCKTNYLTSAVIEIDGGMRVGRL